MTSTGRPGSEPTLRAPTADRTAVVEPPFDVVGALIDQNVQQAAQHHYDLSGRTLADLARHAREEVYREARAHTASYLDLPADAPRGTSRMIFAGHQPQLFHPGVWFKNFVLDAIARRHGATAVNLVIDSDTMKAAGLPTPTGPIERPRREIVPLDRPLPGVAYEDRPVLDREVFAAAGQRVAQRLGGLVPDPLIKDFWPTAVERADATGNLGAAVAQARHRLETAWGAATLEVPQGRVCDTESFRWFAAHLLAELPRFAAAYNEAVREYRQAHRIRNAAQPAPELAADGPWHEAPFWVWTSDNPRRRRFFVRRRADRLQLCDCERLRLDLPLVGGQLHSAVDALGQLARAGVKVRSRALITTLWARLVLGDLFVHGIGGAHYDRVTESVMERFFGIAPPQMMVVSATLHLPLAVPTASVDDLRVIRRQLRELAFHPEAHAAPRNREDQQQLDALIALKRQWIATPPTRGCGPARRRAIRAANEAMQPFVGVQRARLERLRDETARAIDVSKVLAWREYAFCLFPEPTLREFLAGLLPKND